MHLTVPEQSIIKHICHSKIAVNYSTLIVHTKMDYPTIEKNISKMIAEGLVEMVQGRCFIITKRARRNPVIHLLLQETVEERLWTAGGRQRHYSLVNRLVSIIHHHLLMSHKIFKG